MLERQCYFRAVVRYFAVAIYTSDDTLINHTRGTHSLFAGICFIVIFRAKTGTVQSKIIALRVRMSHWTWKISKVTKDCIIWKENSFVAENVITWRISERVILSMLNIILYRWSSAMLVILVQRIRFVPSTTWFFREVHVITRHIFSRGLKRRLAISLFLHFGIVPISYTDYYYICLFNAIFTVESRKTHEESWRWRCFQMSCM